MIVVIASDITNSDAVTCVGVFGTTEEAERAGEEFLESHPPWAFRLIYPEVPVRVYVGRLVSDHHEDIYIGVFASRKKCEEFLDERLASFPPLVRSLYKVSVLEEVVCG